jgi:hypothetical protein
VVVACATAPCGAPFTDLNQAFHPDVPLGGGVTATGTHGVRDRLSGGGKLKVFDYRCVVTIQQNEAVLQIDRHNRFKHGLSSTTYIHILVRAL